MAVWSRSFLSYNYWMKLKKVYRFRLKPTATQEEGLHRLAGARRFVYNWALERRRSYYKEHAKSITHKQLSAELTALKRQPERAWLNESDSQSLQQVLKDLERAFKNFFERRTGYPRFKSRRRDSLTFRIPQRVRVEGEKLYVPKVGWVRFRKSRQIEGRTKGATFKRDAAEKWHVTLVVEFEMPDTPLPAPERRERVVGLDAGLKDFVVLSSGERVPTPRFYRNSERKLKRAQRRLSRKKKGSNNRHKARKKVARVHRKVADKRRDFLHKLSSKLVRAHEGICIEDLSIRGLVRTKLAKSFSDASLGEFRRMLEYKALWHRRKLVKVGRFYPSTKLCSECGLVNAHLTLSQRIWDCCECGTSHDRDLNAATNIRAEGLRVLAAGQAERLNACGGSIRPEHLPAAPCEARIPPL